MGCYAWFICVRHIFKRYLINYCRRLGGLMHIYVNVCIHTQYTNIFEPDFKQLITSNALSSFGHYPEITHFVVGAYICHLQSKNSKHTRHIQYTCITVTFRTCVYCMLHVACCLLLISHTNTHTHTESYIYYLL